MDLSNIMQMANQLREQLSSAQESARKERVVGEAGGGLVKATMNGRYELVELHIDPTAASDVKLLEDLVRAAVNAATSRVEELLKSRMGDMARGMGVDPSMFGGGG